MMFFRKPVFMVSLFTVIFLTGLAQAVNMEVGPYVQFTGPYSAVVRWDTEVNRNSIVEYGISEGSLDQRVESGTSTTTHEIALNNLQWRTKYYCRVGYDNGGEVFTDVFRFDNRLNYTRKDVSAISSPYPVDSLTPLYEEAADRIIAQTGITKGYCLVYGCRDGRLAFELARRSDMMVLGVDADANKISFAREKLLAADVYGTRVTVHHAADMNNLTFSKNFFNLIVSDHAISDGQCVGSAEEMFRVLRPDGGVAYIGQPDSCPSELTASELTTWLNIYFSPGDYTLTDDTNGVWAKVIRDPLPGSGNWPRQFGQPDNAANSNDDLGGATLRGDLQTQWLGWPGADFGADRNPRMPPPIMVHGRLFHQGLNRIAALDSYNGALYWSLEIPNVMRVNTPRECGYVTADDDHLFIAVDDDCWQLDGNTGLRVFTHKLNDPGKEWGYVARSGSLLYGSAQFDDAHYTQIWGIIPGWYDNRTDPAVTAKICSKYLFANNAATGTRVWTYDSADADKGVIINSTITMGNGRLYFVESRDPDVESYSSGRIGIADLWDSQYLVARNTDTGAAIWAQPINTADGVPVFYLDYTAETLILVSSDTTTSLYNIYAYDATTGNPKAGWTTNPVTLSWTSDNHGHHIQHPVIVGGKIFLDQKVYNLSDGTYTGLPMPARGGGCASMIGTASSIIYRGNPSRHLCMWDFQANQTSYWPLVRPSCWLSTIAGGNMVLSPEGGGGCSCNEWFQTSMGFVIAD